MPNLTISAKGESTEDFLLALEEVIGLVEEGYTAGQDSNTCSSFHFHINEDAE